MQAFEKTPRSDLSGHERVARFVLAQRIEHVTNLPDLDEALILSWKRGDQFKFRFLLERHQAKWHARGAHGGGDEHRINALARDERDRAARIEAGGQEGGKRGHGWSVRDGSRRSRRFAG